MGSTLSQGMHQDAPGRVPRWQKAVCILGLLTWAVALAGLAWLWSYDPTQATAGALAVATFYYAGQFGAIPLGLAAGGHPMLIAVYVWAADLAGLWVFFPITQYGVDRLAEKEGFFAHWVRRMRTHAGHRKEFVERYGPWGLFGFTALPFLFNSPILGAVIGRIVGIPARRTLLALSSAITLTTIAWTVIFNAGLDAAETVDERLPWFLGLASVGITVVVALGVALVRWVRKKGHSRAARPAPTAVDEEFQ